MLVILGGLPATGKTSICREIVRRTGAVHVRVDTIEQAIVDARLHEHPVGPGGYVVAYAVAREQLQQGHIVLADSVNPVRATREAWRNVAADAGVPALEAEVVCSDKVEHRRRAEARTVDVPGLPAPSWQQIMDRLYEPWTGARLVLDTAGTALDLSVSVVLRLMADLDSVAALR